MLAFRFVACVSIVLSLLTTPATAQLPTNYQLESDWHLVNSDFKANISFDESANTITMTNGLYRRVIDLRLGSTIHFDNLMTGQAMVRAVEPEAVLNIDGKDFTIGGASGQSNKAFLTEQSLAEMQPLAGSLKFAGHEVNEPKERLKWKRVRHHAPNAVWPPRGKQLRLDFVSDDIAGLLVSIHYEVYDGVPVLSKWLTVENNSKEPVTVERFTAERLSVVEHANIVETREGIALPKPDVLHVETDMAFGGFNFAEANRHTVHWRTDATFSTQVNYLKKMPALLVVEPTYGPSQDIKPDSTFETFRVFELVHDSSDRERRGLALRKMYRTIAPWVTENPIMLHCKTSDETEVRSAIDQAAEVGFEMVILSFGSGFNSENDSAEYLAKWTSINDYAASMGIHLGSYSLYSSRSAGPGNDIVPPDGIKPTHGRCPAITSPWGQAYMAKLYHLFDETGFLVFENDGPYPGDVDTTERLPLQKGIQDSRWVHWRIWTDFYQHLRSRGVYMNLPDYYFLAGSNKCGMGYREVNWSLPREQQRIHTRQNIFDGTWTKTPSMGWMFVPLTQYHGGGAEATIEPLDQHRDHYDVMLKSNLGLGVQACYRGPRLFDTEATKQMVRKNVAWFKKHREILESDVIHGRRADGRDLDWMLHVNATLKEKAMLCVYNPTNEAITKSIKVPLYYSGIREKAAVSENGNSPNEISLDSSARATMSVTVEAQGFAYFAFE